MAKKKNNGNKKSNKESSVHGDVKRGAVAILLFTMSVLCVLGFLGQGAVLGSYLNKISGLLFGWGKWISPFILIGMGAILLFRKETLFYVTKIIGLTLIFFSMLGFFHVFFDQGKLLEIAKAGEGGGYVGYLVSVFLLKLTGLVGGVVILFSFFIIGGIIAFNFSLVDFVRRFINKKVEEFEERDSEDEEEEKEKVEAEVNEQEEEEQDSEDEAEDDEQEEDEKPSILERTTEMLRGKKKQVEYDWELPPLSVLESSSGKAQGGDTRRSQKIIQDTLKHFGIEVGAGDIQTGPTVTQYSFRPAVGVKLSRIVSLNNDLALALAAHPIRIEAPIPGKSMIGIEVPNKSTAMVRIKDLLKDRSFQESESNLTLALGKDVSGNYIISDLKKMPHLMIAGSTNSGKSVCVNSVILSLLYQNSPQDLKLILVDPKRVELSLYNGIPHLLSDVIVENGKVLSALKWAIGEMERRYKRLQETGSRDIMSFNRKADDGETRTYVDPDTNETVEEDLDRLPYIVIIIDELADLMASHGKEVEGAIIRLAQMARAVGIHLIVSTQRPSVEVLTGLIKANIGTRIAFKVATQIDSRTILDSAGAEKLLGNGDMLFSSVTGIKRIQGVFVEEKEVKRAVDFIKKQKLERMEDDLNEEDIIDGGNSDEAADFTVEDDKLDFGSMKFESDENKDSLFEEAKRVVIYNKRASTSFLQRKLRIGYARAASLMDMLEEEGIVSPADGAKPREVLIDGGEINSPDYDDDSTDQQKRDKWQM